MVKSFARIKYKLPLLSIVFVLLALPLSIIAFVNYRTFLPKALEPQAKISPTPITQPSEHTVITVYFVPSDRKPDLVWFKQIPNLMKYAQGWFAARLDNKTFEYRDPILYVSKKPNYFFLEACQREECKSQEMYYNVLYDLKDAGFPVGSANKTNTNLVVFFDGEANMSGAGGAEYEIEPVNMTFLPLKDLEAVKTIDPFTVTPFEGWCFPAQNDCSTVYSLRLIIHELGHTFGNLPHIPFTKENELIRDELVEGSVIDQGTYYPHVSFSVDPRNNERGKTLNSGFMRITLSNIPIPLNRLALHIYELKKGPNPISLPFNPPLTGFTNQPYNLYEILGTANKFCDKVSVYDPDLNGNSVWKTTECGLKLSETYVVPGQAFVVYMNKDKRLLFHGVVPERLPAIQLKKGWNYVGPPWNKYSETPDQSFAQFRNKINAVYYFDTTQNKWLKYVPSIFSLIPNNSDLKIIESGKAYFINMKEDALWALKGYKDGTILYPQQYGGLSNSIPPL